MLHMHASRNLGRRAHCAEVHRQVGVLRVTIVPPHKLSSRDDSRQVLERRCTFLREAQESADRLALQCKHTVHAT